MTELQFENVGNAVADNLENHDGSLCVCPGCRTILVLAASMDVAALASDDEENDDTCPQLLDAAAMIYANQETTREFFLEKAGEFFDENQIDLANATAMGTA